MIVRAITAENDWTFGKGIQNYKSANNAVAQSIQTKLIFFLNDCFFAANLGIDWFNLLGGKNQQLLNLQVSTTIANAPGVLNFIESSFTLDNATRMLTITYSVNTIYTGTTVVVTNTAEFLLTEGGDILTTEDGDQIQV